MNEIHRKFHRLFNIFLSISFHNPKNSNFVFFEYFSYAWKFLTFNGSELPSDDDLPETRERKRGKNYIFVKERELSSDFPAI